jgi:polysaccharide deacetylase 2 family uncharacterized protein YibQ
MILFLATLLAVGVGAVRLFQTPRGKVILLDAGLGDYHAMVQEALDTELRRALAPFGFDRNLDLHERVRAARIRGRDVHVRHWEVSCDAPCDPVKITLAATRAAKKGGGVARSRVTSPEDGEGETLFITVGGRRYPTHEITVHLVTSPRAQLPEPTAPRPRLALVIDDFGYSRNETIEHFLALDIPLTISVIPALPQTGYILKRAQRLGKETILHVPMEGEAEEAGSAAIMTAMGDERIREVLDGFLRKYTGIVGVNNHQGSVATRDRRVMLTVVGVVKKHGIFFLDSLTASESIAYNTAKSLEVPTAKNDVFLDAGTEDADVVEGRLLKLAELSRARGSAIGIGHPKPWTYEAIARSAKALGESGIEFVFVSRLME